MRSFVQQNCLFNKIACFVKAIFFFFKNSLKNHLFTIQSFLKICLNERFRYRLFLVWLISNMQTIFNDFKSIVFVFLVFLEKKKSFFSELYNSFVRTIAIHFFWTTPSFTNNFLRFNNSVKVWKRCPSLQPSWRITCGQLLTKFSKIYLKIYCYCQGKNKSKKINRKWFVNKTLGNALEYRYTHLQAF